MVLVYIGGPHTLGKTTAIKLAAEELRGRLYYIRGAEFVKKIFRKNSSGRKFGEQTNQEMQKLIEEATIKIKELAKENPKKLILVDGHFVINRSGQEAKTFMQLIPECAKYFDGIVLIKGNPLKIQERRQRSLHMRKKEKTRHSLNIEDIKRECYACALEAKALAKQHDKPLYTIDCSSNQQENALRIKKVFLNLLNNKTLRDTNVVSKNLKLKRRKKRKLGPI